MKHVRNLLAWCLVLAIAAPASAQEQVSRAPDANNWIAIIIAILLVIALAIGSFLSSKRGHLD